MQPFTNYVALIIQLFIKLIISISQIEIAIYVHNNTTHIVRGCLFGRGITQCTICNIDEKTRVNNVCILHIFHEIFIRSFVLRLYSNQHAFYIRIISVQRTNVRYRVVGQEYGRIPYNLWPWTTHRSSTVKVRFATTQRQFEPISTYSETDLRHKIEKPKILTKAGILF